MVRSTQNTETTKAGFIEKNYTKGAKLRAKKAMTPLLGLAETNQA